MIKIGLIGCGMVAGYGHLPAIAQTPGLALHALCDLDPSRLQAAQARFRPAHVYTDPAPFFASGIEAVAICTPAPAHLQNVLDAARHSLHVLCEKPLGMSEAEIAGMVDAMSAARRMFFTGFTYRFAEPALRIKQLIADGAIGQVRSLRLCYLWDCHGKYIRDPESPTGFRLDAGGRRQDNARRTGRMVEGGPMVDCGVHQVDLARWWLGSEVVRAQGVGAWVDDYACPDHLYLHMDHADGAHAMVEISFSYAHSTARQRSVFTYEVMGDEGLIRYDRENSRFELYDSHGLHPLPFAEEKGFRPMYRELEQALRTGKPGNLPSGADGLIATRLARQATEQAMHARIT